MVPPKDLRFHIRDAIDVAGANRIGHGVDLLYEDAPYALLEDMVARDILVEINLTSNAVILGVEGPDHPFETYLAAGVPLTLSTDDEGVSRIDLTHEYTRATRTYDLGYPVLKQFARNSLSYAFLSGDSLWDNAATGMLIEACRNDMPGAQSPSPACTEFLAGSEKAGLQWKLERDFTRFEEDWKDKRL